MVTEKKKAIYMCLLMMYVCIADHIEKGKSRFGSIHCDWLQVFMLKLEMVYKDDVVVFVKWYVLKKKMLW